MLYFMNKLELVLFHVYLIIKLTDPGPLWNVIGKLIWAVLLLMLNTSIIQIFLFYWQHCQMATLGTIG